ncbi:unnamed protein product [Anisakis simplex]|uniref:Homeobox domain-containing protein n=1 Tax=Anisakis simplex TaxID=6269 RepID=A0A0M3KDP6_ANISI|nr:unnamed protein product [Anisakis simplex]
MSAVPSTSLLTTTVQTNAICSSNVCATTTITPTTTTINNNITINIGHSKGSTDKNNNNNANNADKTDQEMTDKNNNSKSSDNGDNNSNNDNRSASSLKQLKSSLRLDFSSSSYKKQTYAGDLFSLFKNSPGFFTQDALAQVQKLNGFVPAPSLLNSPSFLTPLIPSANANGDAAKTVNSPVLTSPTRLKCEKLKKFEFEPLNQEIKLAAAKFVLEPFKLCCWNDDFRETD